MSYSPRLRTAVLLTGNGTAGAYHAGALRALHEAGVKIDVMSGRGIGVIGALFAAIDASAKTWEDGGVWRRRPPPRLYSWRPPLLWAAALAIAAVAVLAVPLLVVATSGIAYPLSFLVQMINVDAGVRLAHAHGEMLRHAFAPEALPTVVPRLVTLCLAAAFGVLAVSALRVSPHTLQGGGYRDRGQWWVRLVGAPWSPEPGLRHFRSALWSLFRGPAGAREPALPELSRRYAELLIDNLGQPGFRELIVSVLDVETRTDLMFAVLAEPRRAAYFRRSRGELIDVSGVGRNQLLDALSASIALPVFTEPHHLVFSPESYWKGETHRTCDRVGAAGRLMEELALVGVEQLIVVCADASRTSPHHLSRPGGSLAGRVADQLAASEAAALAEAVAAHQGTFKGLFVIQPARNPIGPFDFDGVYDERSDRRQHLGELVDRGYEDAYRQFVDPVVGGAE